MAPSYFYLRPGVFNLVGFSYGKVDGTLAREAKVKVKLVQSGRWSEEPPQAVELPQEELAPRVVSVAEAENGVGTFVGGVICTSRVRSGTARVWDYGLVIGYSWEPELQHGLLDVNFRGAETSLKFVSDTTQDVAVEIYALQPCAGQSTSFVMAREMRQIHDKVYNKFNGIDQPAIRDATQLLEGVRSDELDEAQILPLLDIGNFAIAEVSVQHILDYVYYKDGGRPHPSEAIFGDTIFDKPIAQQEPRTLAATEVVLSDGLSDSDDDAADPPTAHSGVSSTQQRETKRRRLNVQGRTALPDSIHSDTVLHGVGGNGLWSSFKFIGESLFFSLILLSCVRYLVGISVREDFQFYISAA
ncbi:hypothetical protein PHYSODRAFT_516942 [Phytophthora sojae]|uniref:Uncharacterized protein n=1 Tax=Phytophthora sojae (strain P6497) TaxID=1094619 RepID=G4ZXI5_PHYSP|nr:hypothetical protein PHYSODRAFT_516942 [Phytophthora sojae]EGZ11848.1 hypothetical protein PHYSODRAFT_516942 [Phytophthora sojae]|eukprot:XP_009532181.1 hypothetical protein PHYSODRAFT_516942 [Phytophthora sojae]